MLTEYPASGFTVTDDYGVLATSLCPGEIYNLALTFPASRRSLLTASDGTFMSASSGCPNRRIIGVSAGPESVYTVSCTATGSVTFKVTSAGSNTAEAPTNRRWAYASLTVAVDDSCASAACEKPT
ncbi:hypothetical protein GPECTOR_9g578 [Gonium pectorale]|uniref:Uncharacterized protein n=1 Tax=Gonium pectorale TaxID=33097 RepID=A0A150GRZ5_GONPE|nr:hypothetical protein GPECTOR_9g578 [Gonium pectorale]|eukprot:KXZ52534.1 hypothetical protein GPECTOR_9g578 [Gonium pectorale]